jgi:hypothetical protein
MTYVLVMTYERCSVQSDVQERCGINKYNVVRSCKTLEAQKVIHAKEWLKSKTHMDRANAVSNIK